MLYTCITYQSKLFRIICHDIHSYTAVERSEYLVMCTKASY